MAVMRGMVAIVFAAFAFGLFLIGAWLVDTVRKIDPEMGAVFDETLGPALRRELDGQR